LHARCLTGGGLGRRDHDGHHLTRGRLQAHAHHARRVCRDGGFPLSCGFGSAGNHDRAVGVRGLREAVGIVARIRAEHGWHNGRRRHRGNGRRGATRRGRIHALGHRLQFSGILLCRSGDHDRSAVLLRLHVRDEGASARQHHRRQRAGSTGPRAASVARSGGGRRGHGRSPSDASVRIAF